MRRGSPGLKKQPLRDDIMWCIKCSHSDLINTIFFKCISFIYPIISFIIFFSWCRIEKQNKQKTVTKYEISQENITVKEGFTFLPEWFESEKTSPHHNEKVGAGCDHCAHTLKAPGLLNIVPACVPSGVKTITFHQSLAERVRGTGNFPAPTAVRAVLLRVSNFSGNLSLSLPAAPGRCSSLRSCRENNTNKKKWRLSFNNCLYPCSESWEHSGTQRAETGLPTDWPSPLDVWGALSLCLSLGIAPSNDSDWKNKKKPNVFSQKTDRGWRKTNKTRLNLVAYK